MKCRLQEVIVRDGKLWSRVHYYWKPPYWREAGRAFVQTDPLTGASVRIPFPPQLETSEPAFEVIADSLFACSTERLLRCRLREKRWEEIPIPMEGRARITALNGRLYLATGAGLLELEPESGAVQVLASSRRRPAVNELDSLWDSEARVFSRADDRLGVQAADRLFSFDPDGRAWSSVVAFGGDRPFERYVFCGSEGAEWLLCGFSSRRYLVAFWNDRAGPELLLEQHNPREPKDGGAVIPALKNPRWDWPEPFRLDFPFYILDGQSLWMLHPRILPWGAGGNPDSEPVSFQDKRQATLLNFSTGRRESQGLGLVFRKDGRPIDLFDQRHMRWMGGFAVQEPKCLPTDQGLVIASSEFAGHWLITKATLQSRLAPLPAAQLRQAVHPSASARTTGTSTNSSKAAQP